MERERGGSCGCWWSEARSVGYKSAEYQMTGRKKNCDVSSAAISTRRHMSVFPHTLSLTLVSTALPRTIEYYAHCRKSLIWWRSISDDLANDDNKGPDQALHDVQATSSIHKHALKLPYLHSLSCTRTPDTLALTFPTVLHSYLSQWTLRTCNPIQPLPHLHSQSYTYPWTH
jgi:hypothetical protein